MSERTLQRRPLIPALIVLMMVATPVAAVKIMVESSPGCGPNAELGDECPDREFRMDGETGLSRLVVNDNSSRGYLLGGLPGGGAHLAGFSAVGALNPWTRTFSHPDNDYDIIDLHLSEDGEVLLATWDEIIWDETCDETICYSEDNEIELHALRASDGADLWNITIDSSSDYDSPTDITTDVDAGRVYLSAHRAVGSGATSQIYALDLADGSLVWEDDEASAGADENVGIALGLSSDGAVLYTLSGSELINGTWVMRVRALNTTDGAELWDTHVTGPAGSFSPVMMNNALAITPDGTSVVAANRAKDADGDARVTLFSFDAITGAELWLTQYAEFEAVGDHPTDLVLSADGSRAFVSARTGGPDGTPDFTGMAFDTSAGALLWSTRYDTAYDVAPSDMVQVHGLSYEAARAVSYDPDNDRVFFSGFTIADSLGGRDLLVRGHDAADGSLVVKARHGTLEDEVIGLGDFLPTSNVFVLGGRASGEVRVSLYDLI